MANAVSKNLKIFCVGLPKTGTSSLYHLMHECGFEVRGRNQAQFRAFVRKDYDSVLRYYDTADYFSDWPTPLMYKLAFEKYQKDARFILSLRKNAHTWFESLKRHNLYAHPLKNKHRWVFGRLYPHGFAAEHRAYYEQHNSEVIRFLQEKGALDQLLIIRVDEPDATRRIGEFLGIDIQRTRTPHANPSRSDRPGLSNSLKKRYNQVIQPTYGLIAPRLFGPPHHLLPVDPERGRSPGKGTRLGAWSAGIAGAAESIQLAADVMLWPLA